jgi:glycosyltransferase involved in cell wall biosynthesis
MADKVLIIVPAFNEEASIERVLKELTQISFPEARTSICVINDGSTDRTAAIAYSYSVILINLPINLGVGGAIRAGYRFAVDQGFNKVIHFDADGQHSSKHLQKMLNALEENDVVIGSRYGAGDNSYRTKFHVRVAQIVLSTLIKIMHGLSVKDPTSGFRATRGELVKIYSRIYPSMFLADTIGSTIQAKHHGFKITEILTPMNDRENSKSSIGLPKRIKYFLLSLNLILFWRDGSK